MMPPEFQLFGKQHFAALGVLAGFCALISCMLGKLPDPGRRWIGRLIGSALLVYTALFYIRQYSAGWLSWEYSLPLDFCSLVLIACILSMFLPGRLQYEIAYFWGLGGTTLALITPDLGKGFPSWDFVLFFWSHGGILVGIVFIITGMKFRPERGSILRMMIAVNIYAVVIGAVDWILGWNYGYLCRKPAIPSLIDYLGPWPWYLLSMEGLALLIFSLLYRLFKKQGNNT
ncbi:MAG: TIGR02206 family membrane protein [Acidobacteriota bacterium]|jgi:hypothetical integral membrane protein (TIGR02206 family)